MATPEVFVCSTVVNRPVRTRMPGGVGGWGLKPPGYPIRIRMSSFELSSNLRRKLALEFWVRLDKAHNIGEILLSFALPSRIV